MSERDPINWDELDAETQHELVSLAEKLGEESGQGGGRTASRREFLGAITAAGLGGSLLSEGADRAFEDFVNPASAGTQSVAQFGEAGEPFDIVAEDIYGPGGQGSGDSVNFESVSTGKQLINKSTVVWNTGGLETYPATASGIKTAVSNMAKNSLIQIPPGQYNMGTDTLTLPQYGNMRGVGQARGSRLIFDEGVGRAVEIDRGAQISQMTISGPQSATSSDIGVYGIPGTGQARIHATSISRFAKNAYFDNYYNNTLSACSLGGATGDRSAFSEAASLHFDVSSGANNNNRVIGCFFSANKIGPSIVSESNELQVFGYQGEANEAGAIKIAFGSGNQIIGVREQNLKGGDGIVVDDGSTTIAATDMNASGSSQNGINMANASAGDVQTLGPHFFSGFGNNFNGVGNTANAKIRES